VFYTHTQRAHTHTHTHQTSALYIIKFLQHTDPKECHEK